MRTRLDEASVCRSRSLASPVVVVDVLPAVETNDSSLSRIHRGGASGTTANCVATPLPAALEWRRPRRQVSPSRTHRSVIRLRSVAGSHVSGWTCDVSTNDVTAVGPSTRAVNPSMSNRVPQQRASASRIHCSRSTSGVARRTKVSASNRSISPRSLVRSVAASSCSSLCSKAMSSETVRGCASESRGASVSRPRASSARGSDAFIIPPRLAKDQCRS
jgi:hypothetical protein